MLQEKIISQTPPSQKQSLVDNIAPEEPQALLEDKSGSEELKALD
jgi:hypothetical protein